MPPAALQDKKRFALFIEMSEAHLAALHAAAASLRSPGARDF